MFSTETLQTQKQFEITKKEKVLQISSCVQPVFISQLISFHFCNQLPTFYSGIHLSTLVSNFIAESGKLMQYIPEQNFHIVEFSISKWKRNLHN